MSEYQYYEFLALDRPLTVAEMAALRTVSSRAKITPSQFVNFYSFGNFRGDPLKLMEQYFDAFVYVANWGTRHLMFRLPRQLLDPDVVAPYCEDQGVMLHERGNHAILSLEVHTEEPIDWEEGEEWLPRLVALRQEIMDGDLRGLYLGWLAGMQQGMFDDDDTEPPVPLGLGNLSPALQALAEFFWIEDDLLAAGAERSAPAIPSGPSQAERDRWLASLPVAEKDALLLQVMTGGAGQVRAGLLNRFRQAHRPDAALPAQSGDRTVGELLAAAEQRTAERKRLEAERKAREQAETQRRKAAARAVYLDSMSGKEPQLWAEAEQLAETKRPADYDRAVQLLEDLRDLGLRSGGRNTFVARLADFRNRHARKPSLTNRLDNAGLRPVLV